MGALADDAAEVTKRAFSSIEQSMSETEAGKDMAKLIQERYIPTFHTALQTYTDAASKLPTAQQPHPLKIHSMAKNIARNTTFGQNDAVAAYLVDSVKKQSGLNPAQIMMRQQNLADNLHMFLHDTNEKAAGLGNYSSSKRNIHWNKEYDLKHIDINADYKRPKETEQALNRYAQYAIAPAIAIPHIGTVLNYTLSTPLRDLNGGLSELMTNNAAIKQLAKDSGALGQNTFDAYSTRWYGARGMTAKVSGSPEIGRIAAQLTHQPFFNQTREMQIAFGVGTSKHLLENMADRLVNNPNDKRAQYEIQNEMRMDYKEILARRTLNNQTGRYQANLNYEDYKKAAFNFVDKKIFLDNSLKRAYYSRKSPGFRLSLMYHGYVNAQARLLGETLKKPYMTRDPTLIPQLFATLGVLFPMAGIALNSLEMTARGQWSEAHPIKDTERLFDFSDQKGQLQSLIEGWSHVGAFGVMQSYTTSIFRHELANQVLGPIGNVAVNLLSDPVVGVKKFIEAKNDSQKQHSLDQETRDILELSLGDNLGKILSNRFLPTQTEERSRNPKLSKTRTHLKHIKGLSGLK